MLNGTVKSQQSTYYTVKYGSFLETEKRRQSLSVVDRGVHQQYLSEIVPHDTALTSRSNDSHEVAVIGQKSFLRLHERHQFFLNE